MMSSNIIQSPLIYLFKWLRCVRVWTGNTSGE